MSWNSPPDPLSPLEKIVTQGILGSLFDLFVLRGFRMTSGKKSEGQSPQIISLLEVNPRDYRVFETLDEISEAGPEYLVEFYDFITGYLSGLLA